MSSRKRRKVREGEGNDEAFLLPVSKQTKINDYFKKDEEEEIISYNVPVSNQFSPLAECPDFLPG